MGKIKQYFSMQRVLLLALLFVCLAPLSALAQTIQLTGTVTDTKGESLIGASVLEKGTSNGCITDFKSCNLSRFFINTDYGRVIATPFQTLLICIDW